MRGNGLVVSREEVLGEAKRYYVHYLNENLNQEELANYSESDIDQVALSFLQKDEGKHYIELHERLSRDKVLAFIKKNIAITVEDVTISVFDQKRFALA